MSLRKALGCWLWLLLCCVTVSRQLSITDVEVPAAARSGEDVELRCRFELGEQSQEQPIVKWWFTPIGGGPKLIYQRMDGAAPSTLPHVEVKAGELDTVVLRGVSPLDSGAYECECEVSSLAEERRRANLVVYTPGSGPLLTIEREEAGDVSVLCAVSDAAPAPDLIIKLNGNEETITKQVSGPDARGLFDISANVSVSAADAADALLTCDLVYEDGDLAHPPYTVSDVISSGAASTQPYDDVTELDATTETPLAEPTGHGCHIGAPWVLLAAAAAAAALARGPALALL